MTIRYTYQNGPLYIEAYAETPNERLDVLNAINDAVNKLHIMDLVPVQEKPYEEKIEESLSKLEPASEKQIQYMKKLKINVPENCTKLQAIDLINEFKLAHNIPISGKN